MTLCGSNATTLTHARGGDKKKQGEATCEEERRNKQGDDYIPCLTCLARGIVIAPMLAAGMGCQGGASKIILTTSDEEEEMVREKTEERKEEREEA